MYGSSTFHMNVFLLWNKGRRLCRVEKYFKAKSGKWLTLEIFSGISAYICEEWVDCYKIESRGCSYWEGRSNYFWRLLCGDLNHVLMVSNYLGISFSFLIFEKLIYNTQTSMNMEGPPSKHFYIITALWHIKFLVYSVINKSWCFLKIITYKLKTYILRGVYL